MGLGENVGAGGQGSRMWRARRAARPAAAVPAQWQRRQARMPAGRRPPCARKCPPPRRTTGAGSPAPCAGGPPAVAFCVDTPRAAGSQACNCIWWAFCTAQLNERVASRNNLTVVRKPAEVCTALQKLHRGKYGGGGPVNSGRRSGRTGQRGSAPRSGAATCGRAAGQAPAPPPASRTPAASAPQAAPPRPRCNKQPVRLQGSPQSRLGCASRES